MSLDSASEAPAEDELDYQTNSPASFMGYSGECCTPPHESKLHPASVLNYSGVVK